MLDSYECSFYSNVFSYHYVYFLFKFLTDHGICDIKGLYLSKDKYLPVNIDFS